MIKTIGSQEPLPLTPTEAKFMGLVRKAELKRCGIDG